MPKHMIWQRLKFTHILSLIMHFHTGDVYWGAVTNVHVSIFLTKKQIISIQKQQPELGFTFITSLDFVLLMVEFYWNKKICYMCKQKYLSDKYTKIYTRIELVMMEIKFLIFVPVSTYQQYKSWPFSYHMCAYLVQIIVVQCDAQPSNDVNYFKMFYGVVIMLRGYLQDLLIK